jgi:hypothetical protein
MHFKNNDLNIDTDTVLSCNEIQTLEKYEFELKKICADNNFHYETRNEDDKKPEFKKYMYTQNMLLSQIRSRLKYLRKNTIKQNYEAYAEFWLFKCKELDPKNFDKYRKQATAYVKSYSSILDKGEVQ